MTKETTRVIPKVDKLKLKIDLINYLNNTSCDIIGICSNDTDALKHDMEKYINRMDEQERYELCHKLYNRDTPLKIAYGQRGFVLALATRLKKDADYYDKFLDMAGEFICCTKIQGFIPPYITKTQTPTYEIPPTPTPEITQISEPYMPKTGDIESMRRSLTDEDIRLAYSLKEMVISYLKSKENKNENIETPRRK